MAPYFFNLICRTMYLMRHIKLFNTEHEKNYIINHILANFK